MKPGYHENILAYESQGSQQFKLLLMLPCGLSKVTVFSVLTLEISFAIKVVQLADWLE